MRRRGEFKTPGGKLIAVEFEIVAGRLCRVVVTGDFFLYPEEALPALSRGLEGSPATLSQDAYAARIAAEMGPDIALIGASPDALAAAVTRALEGSEAGDRQ